MSLPGTAFPLSPRSRPLVDAKDRDTAVNFTRVMELGAKGKGGFSRVIGVPETYARDNASGKLWVPVVKTPTPPPADAEEPAAEGDAPTAPPKPEVMLRRWATRGDIPQLTHLLNHPDNVGNELPTPAPLVKLPPSVRQPQEPDRRALWQEGAAGVNFDINARNRHNGFTSIHWACQNGYVEILLHLLSKGADWSLLDAMSRTGRDIAALKTGEKYAEIVELLESLPAEGPPEE